MILSFSRPTFERLIREGIKQHTIREDKPNRWKPGKVIHFWHGNPRNVHARYKPRQFGVGICSRVEDITMCFQNLPMDEPDYVIIGNEKLSNIEELNALAINDGFENWGEMRAFFHGSHKKFMGKIIFWKDYDHR